MNRCNSGTGAEWGVRGVKRRGSGWSPVGEAWQRWPQVPAGGPDGGLGQAVRATGPLLPFSIRTQAPLSPQVAVQCLLLLEVLGGSHKHAVDSAVKKLTKLWREVTGGHGGWRALLPVRILTAV